MASAVAELLPDLRLELHAGFGLAFAALRREPRFCLQRSQPLRHLGSVMESLQAEVPLAGAVLDLRGLALPPSAVSWFRAQTPEALCRIFQKYGEQEDDLLWARFAEVVVAAREDQPLTVNADMTRLFTQASARLADPAGPAPAAAMNALRLEIRQEQTALEDCLLQLFPRMEVGARLVVLLDHHGLAAALRAFIRRHEDVDDVVAEGLPPHKVATLFPLSTSTQSWCLAEVTHRAEALPLSASLSAKEVFVVEKHRSKVPADPARAKKTPFAATWPRVVS